MVASPISILRIGNVTSTTDVGTYAGEGRLIYLVETGECSGKDEGSLLYLAGECQRLDAMYGLFIVDI